MESDRATAGGLYSDSKIEEAKQMLETTGTPIDEIAEEVGYTESSSFRNAFRRYVGMPASTYRKKRLALIRVAPDSQ